MVVFPISGQSLIKENCHNSRTIDDIDMKLGRVTKLGKGNKTMSIKFDHDVISANCNVIVIFPIYGHFRAIQKPYSGWDAESVKLIFSLTVTFYLTKTENRTKKSFTQLSHYCFD